MILWLLHYSLFDLLIAGLHIFLGYPLLAPITLRIDCLIRGNHDKLHHIMFASQIGQVLVPSILVRMACDGFSSINGAYAAA
jgi:hypothetical protein